jgi:hypothetical protein
MRLSNKFLFFGIHFDALFKGCVPGGNKDQSLKRLRYLKSVVDVNLETEDTACQGAMFANDTTQRSLLRHTVRAICNLVASSPPDGK